MSEWSGGLTAFYRRDFAMTALNLAARSCGVAPREVAASHHRRASVAFARQLAMYLCHVVGDMSLRDVADTFDRNRTTVSHACHAIEDRRDDPIFDRQIDDLEQELRRKMRAMADAAIAEPPLQRKHFRLAG